MEKIIWLCKDANWFHTSYCRFIQPSRRLESKETSVLNARSVRMTLMGLSADEIGPILPVPHDRPSSKTHTKPFSSRRGCAPSNLGARGWPLISQTHVVCWFSMMDSRVIKADYPPPRPLETGLLTGIFKLTLISTVGYGNKQLIIELVIFRTCTSLLHRHVNGCPQESINKVHVVLTITGHEAWQVCTGYRLRSQKVNYFFLKLVIAKSYLTIFCKYRKLVHKSGC